MLIITVSFRFVCSVEKQFATNSLVGYQDFINRKNIYA